MASSEILTDVESGYSGGDYLHSSEQEKKSQDQKKASLLDQFEGSSASDDVSNDIKDLLDNIPQLNTIFNVIAKIGSGTFSSVYLAQLKNHSRDQMFALKHIIPTSHPSRIENELRCLLDIGGKDNIIEAKACFREKDHVVIVMPYFSHDRFHDYVHLLDVSEIRLYMKALLTAVSHVHSINVIHRDVKPSNFLFNRTLKQFALVDFGLAQRVTTPKSQDINTNKSKPTNIATIGISANVSDTTLPSVATKLEDCVKAAPRKRRLESTENDRLPAVKVPCMSKPERQKIEFSASSKQSHDDDRRLKTLDQNRITQLPSAVSATVFKTTYSKPIASRNTLVAKPLLSAHRIMENVTEASKGKAPLAESGRQNNVRRYSGSDKSCNCYGQPTVCNICLFRTIQHAPRAGTPGFRAPEVLMKYPGQTTAVDIWSVGVIFLSLLSGCYPFFKAADDLTSLAQIISIFGYNKVKNAAKCYGKSLLVSPEVPGHDLKELCERLHCVATPSQNKGFKAKSPNRGTTKSHDEVPDSAYGLLSSLLDLNPFTRITAVKALQHPFFAEQP